MSNNNNNKRQDNNIYFKPILKFRIVSFPHPERSLKRECSCRLGWTSFTVVVVRRRRLSQPLDHFWHRQVIYATILSVVLDLFLSPFSLSAHNLFDKRPEWSTCSDYEYPCWMLALKVFDTFESLCSLRFSDIWCLESRIGSVCKQIPWDGVLIVYAVKMLKSYGVYWFLIPCFFSS